MSEWIEIFLEQQGLNHYGQILSSIFILLFAGIICLIARMIMRVIIVRVAVKMSKKTKNVWDDILLEKKFFHRLADLTIPITLTLFLNGFFQNSIFLNRLVGILMVMVVVRMSDAFINGIDKIYRGYDISKIKPMRGMFQVIKTIIFIMAAVIFIAILIGQNPMTLLGGIGAMTAITSFVFKDAILGFVAGIQLSSNDMVRIGDWIEMPKYSANGTVTELSLTTVKVENFDRTITTIPAYALVSDAFINWRGMEASGGRRMKRAIYIHAGDVAFCEDEMLMSLSKIKLLTKYLKDKKEEIQKDNQVKGIEDPINSRRLTNLGVFRVYIDYYLKQHAEIHQGMILMVRQLEATNRGIPLEIYAFTNTIEWVEYEVIQANIFDHLYAMAPYFGLSVFQEPSGKDIRSLSM